MAIVCIALAYGGLWIYILYDSVEGDVNGFSNDAKLTSTMF